MKNMTVTNPTKARAAGHYPLTITYLLPREKEMLEGVLRDMRRGNIAHCLVKSNGGVEVWRQRGRRGGVSPQTIEH